MVCPYLSLSLTLLLSYPFIFLGMIQATPLEIITWSWDYYSSKNGTSKYRKVDWELQRTEHKSDHSMSIVLGKVSHYRAVSVPLPTNFTSSTPTNFFSSCSLSPPPF